MALAIIPARGGSKGIPHKNIVSVCGRPLIAWSIEDAQECLSIERVIVTTDCEEIATVAKSCGAEVFWRGAETATDTATTESAVSEVLATLSPLPHITVLLQATSPLRQPHDIHAAMVTLLCRGYDSIFSARAVEGYVWRSEDAGLERLHGRRPPRQLRTDKVWEENGSFYIFRTDAYLQEHDRHCGSVGVYPMHPLDSYQIDEPADVPILESLMEVRHVSASPA